jgi:hypothetical protein
MISAEFTRVFGVEHPILCGGMTGSILAEAEPVSGDRLPGCLS